MTQAYLNIFWVLRAEADRIRDARAVGRRLARPGSLWGFTLIIDGATEYEVVLIL
jgi:hypothetical protein